MNRMNIVLKRYDDPKPLLGVHYEVGDGRAADLVPPDRLEEFFTLGNEITITVDDIYNQIPMEWKAPDVTDEWILGRVTAYDTITRNEEAYQAAMEQAKRRFMT